MRKIPTLFERCPTNRKLVVQAVTAGCEWALSGEPGVVARRKLDGSCCLVEDGKLYRRHAVKEALGPYTGTPAPVGFRPCETDPVTKTTFGWVPVGDGPADRWHREAWELLTCNDCVPRDGTYELCGPKVQGNPERFGRHLLLPHAGAAVVADCPCNFDALRKFFLDVLGPRGCEGIVWHRGNGDMCKLKVRDFRE